MNVRYYTQIRIDRGAFGLVLLFLMVITGAVLYAPSLVSSPSTQPVFTDQSPTSQVTTGGIIALLEVTGAVILLGLIVGWRRLPMILKEPLSSALKAGFFLLLGAWATTTRYPLGMIIGLMGLLFVMKLTDRLNVWWIMNNILAVMLAVYFGALIGVTLPVLVLAVFLVGLTVYDHVFANQQSWMFTLGGSLVSKRLPVIFIVPNSIRLEWGELVDAITEEDEEETPIGFGIGTADLLLPASFITSVWIQHDTTMVLPVIGAVLGVVLAGFRLRWLTVNSTSGAGLPSITTGVLGGYLIGLLPFVVMGVSKIGY